MRDNPINALRERLRLSRAVWRAFGLRRVRRPDGEPLSLGLPFRGARDPAPIGRNGFSSKSISITIASPSLVAMMGLQAGPWRLTMDRTNWLGRRDVNILMIGIVNRAIAIPVCWRVLDKAGNSNTKERIAILEHVLRHFRVDKIASLLADREFIGDAWLAWLQEKAIPFHIRIRKIANTRGHGQARELFRDLKPGELHPLQRQAPLGGQKTQGQARIRRRAPSQDRRTVDRRDQRRARGGLGHAQRQIETLFAALKTRGFNLEDTHMTDPERISKLTAVLSNLLLGAQSRRLAPRGRADPPQNPQKDGKIHLPIRFRVATARQRQAPSSH